MKKLANLKWSPHWVSHLGCVKGCVDYLGLDISTAWLYGGTGHAFVINIHDEVCPSGPTAWKTVMLYELGENLGYVTDDAVFGWKSEGNLAELQENAWAFTRQNIDQGLPVYGWELMIPEFYVVYGYDEVGYYYSGTEADDGKGPKPWRELADTGIGLMEIYRIKPGEAKEPRLVVKSAFEKVLYHAGNPKDWIMDGYHAGLAGFDVWIKALESGKADRFGMGYNSQVWRECRGYAVGFLKEAKERLSGEAGVLLDEGLEHYQVVADRLAQVCEKYPFDLTTQGQVIERDDKCQRTLDLLKETREAEAAGLKVLEKIVAALGA
jgi:hypothetical protein